jgi:hypothetical protein
MHGHRMAFCEQPAGDMIVAEASSVIPSIHQWNQLLAPTDRPGCLLTASQVK